MSITAEQRTPRRTRLRRRRRVLLPACTLAVAALLISCGSSDSVAETTPGYDGDAETLDTTPFTMATAPGAVTTLPEGFFDPEQVGPTTAPTTVPITTSTTPPSSAAPLSTDDPLCIVVHDLMTSVVDLLQARIKGASIEDVAMQTALELGQGANDLRGLGNYDLAAEGIAFADSIDRSTMLIASSTTYEELRGRLAQLFDSAEQGPQYARLTQRLQTVCPEQISLFL